MTYIFDFDGTLVDSMPVFVKTMTKFFEEIGFSCPDDFLKKTTPLGYKATAEYAQRLGMSISVEQFTESAKEYTSYDYINTIPAKPGVLEKLTQLKQEGHSLNVLTASPHSVLDVCLKRVGLYDLFDNVWIVDDFDSTKAEAKIYHDVAKRLGKNVNECIFLDDNFGAISAAKEAGMITIAVYDESSADLADEMKKAADKYIYHFSEL
ncbi:MAG: HAD family phosphatase [Monoglobales bacterium]